MSEPITDAVLIMRGVSGKVRVIELPVVIGVDMNYDIDWATISTDELLGAVRQYQSGQRVTLILELGLDDKSQWGMIKDMK